MRLNRIIIVIFLILYSFVLIVFFYNSLGRIDLSEGGILGSGYVQFFLLFLSLCFVVLNINKIKTFPNVFGYGLFFLFYTLLSLFSADVDIARNVYRVTAWYFLFLMGFMVSFNNEKDRDYIHKWMIFVVLSLSIYLIVDIVLLSSTIETFRIFDASFLVLFLLPFAFTLRTNTLKYFFVIAIGFIAFLSLKRSTVFAFIAGTIAYHITLLYNSNLKKKKLIITLLWFFFISILIQQVFLFSDQITEGYITTRMEELWESGGSGRDELFPMFWLSIKGADIITLLFGHGYNATENNFGVYAHNDFLEIIYNYGIIAFSAYFLLLRSLFLFGVRLAKNRAIPSKVSAAYFSALTILLFLGMFNVIVLNPHYFGTAMFFMGLQIGTYHQIKFNQKSLMFANGSLIR